MASLLSFLFLFSFCFFINIRAVFLGQSHIYLPTERLQKFSHLHFYSHDILDTKNPTSVKIINPTSSDNNSPNAFGTTHMVDNPLTEEQDPSSKLIGRAQGTYALASKNGFGLKMDINFVFIDGIYKGSTLSMLGRNAIMNSVREMPIVGGTGAFRFARGFALAKTVWYNSTSGNAIEEFNVTVCHF
ncbi:hypothetical protein RIF29_20598 [Crotalaria pallida]|uniref:Dirigent protein n=1 Tax=Crotalaria pallida TaxID=3830 RepID=A0AAN9F1F3_CROPI